MIQIDLYTQNYLGELETTLIEKNNQNQIVFELRIFSADFISIIDWIPYTLDSHIESLIYLINVDESFGNDFTLLRKVS